MATVTINSGDNAASLTVAGTDMANASHALAEFFASEGYALEEGTPDSGSYGKGSNLKRLILGSFAKRFKFSVAVTETSEGAQVVIGKAMSGNAGGLRGRKQMQNEFQRITTAANGWLSQRL